MSQHTPNWDEMWKQIRNVLPQSLPGNKANQLEAQETHRIHAGTRQWNANTMSALFLLSTDAGKFGTKEFQWMSKTFQEGIGNNKLQEKVIGGIVRGMMDAVRESAGLPHQFSTPGKKNPWHELGRNHMKNGMAKLDDQVFQNFIKGAFSHDFQNKLHNELDHSYLHMFLETKKDNHIEKKPVIISKEIPDHRQKNDDPVKPEIKTITEQVVDSTAALGKKEALDIPKRDHDKDKESFNFRKDNNKQQEQVKKDDSQNALKEAMLKITQRLLQERRTREQQNLQQQTKTKEIADRLKRMQQKTEQTKERDRNIVNKTANAFLKQYNHNGREQVVIEKPERPSKIESAKININKDGNLFLAQLKEDKSASKLKREKMETKVKEKRAEENRDRKDRSEKSQTRRSQISKGSYDKSRNK